MPSWDALLTAPWRGYPAGVLIVVGVVFAVRSIMRERRDLGRPPTDPGLGFALIRALRGTLSGLAFVGMGIGWLATLPPLIIVSALIGLEELLEISSVIRALRAGKR
jgi:hypothetical protein